MSPVTLHLHLSAEPPDVNNNKQLCKNMVPKDRLKYWFSRLSVLRKVSHFLWSFSTFYCKNVFRSPWNQVRRGVTHSLRVASLDLGFCPLEIHLKFLLYCDLSWCGILMTSFSVDLVHVSFVSFAVGDLLGYLL